MELPGTRSGRQVLRGPAGSGAQRALSPPLPSSLVLLSGRSFQGLGMGRGCWAMEGMKDHGQSSERGPGADSQPLLLFPDGREMAKAGLRRSEQPQPSGCLQQFRCELTGAGLCVSRWAECERERRAGKPNSVGRGRSHSASSPGASLSHWPLPRLCSHHLQQPL